jgi:hypothetical protein
MRTIRTVCVLRLLWLVLMLPAAVQAQSYTNSDGVVYTFNSGVWTVTRYTGPGGAVTILDAINGYAVTSIGTAAFDSCTSLSDVSIVPSVTNIGERAFHYCGLTNVTIGTNVTSIGYDAFNYCSGLTTVTIPDSVASIGGQAFAVCGLTNVTIGKGVISIGDRAFKYCNLTDVTLPQNLANIGANAFYYCQYLSSIAIPASVTNIGSTPFDHCWSLTAITVDSNNPAYSSSVDGVLFNKSQTTLIECPGGKQGSYAIPDSVTNIAMDAFCFCLTLTNVTIGTNVASIGYEAFYQCRDLTTVSIPNSVTVIKDRAFYNCPSLANITIPDSVTDLGSDVFAYCFSLTSATIGTNVTIIRERMFAYCTSLTSVTIPNSVTSIRDFAFQYCTSLTSVTIPNSVTSLGWNAFEYCFVLSGVYFKGNAIGVSSGLFSGDTNVTVYYLPGTTGWNPKVQTGGADFGVRTNKFGFSITGTTGLGIVVEACTNLANPLWSPLRTNTLTGNPFYFSDALWTNYPSHFYRAWGQTFGGRPMMLWNP